MSLVAIRLFAEIVELLSRAYGTVEDKRLARRDQERDEKIRELERQTADLKRQVDAKETPPPCLIEIAAPRNARTGEMMVASWPSGESQVYEFDGKCWRRRTS